jgi:hypothetical protein
VTAIEWAVMDARIAAALARAAQLAIERREGKV